MTSDFREYAAVMCRIDENAITEPIVFNLPFKIREKNSLYMRELDSFPHIIRKMHKHTPVFVQIYEISYFFRKSSKNSTFYPYNFEEKVPLL